jgi:hypothetical protein
MKPLSSKNGAELKLGRVWLRLSMKKIGIISLYMKKKSEIKRHKKRKHLIWRTS